MNTFCITTDSVVDMTLERMEELETAFVPLHVHFGNEDFPDDMRPETTAYLFEQMRKGQVATTSQATVDSFLSLWEPMLKAGKDILYIGFSNALSGTMNSALVARSELAESYPERSIFIVDTLGGSASESLLLEEAVELKRNGNDIKSCFNTIEKLKLKIQYWFTLAELTYVRRGGRVTGTAAAIGTLLDIKPIMEVNLEGKIIPREKVKGRRASIKRLAELVFEKLDVLSAKLIHITHAECLDDARKLAELVKDRFPKLIVRIYPMGAVIGAHGGPGALSIAFAGGQRKI